MRQCNHTNFITCAFIVNPVFQCIYMDSIPDMYYAISNLKVVTFHVKLDSNLPFASEYHTVVHRLKWITKDRKGNDMKEISGAHMYTEVQSKYFIFMHVYHEHVHAHNVLKASILSPINIMYWCIKLNQFQILQ